MLVACSMLLALAVSTSAMFPLRPTATSGAVDHSAYSGMCHSEAQGDAIRKVVVQVGACRFTPPCHPPPRHPPPPAPPATGFMTKIELRLPEVQTPPVLEKYTFSIPDKCREAGKQMVGMVVHACDEDVAPSVDVAGSGVGYACLHRHGVRFGAARVYMHQYCL